jgi:5-carboxyvanillate decarboxylase
MKKIGTEEACSIPEIAAALGACARTGWDNLDLKLVNQIYNAPAGGPVPALLTELLDIDNGRLKVMDENGVDMHLLSLTAPGVQMFDADTAVELVRLANDRMTEACRKHPTRFSMLASFAPQDPKRAVAEMERAVKDLKCNGFMVNSHTNNEYLDLPKYWPILEAAEAMNMAIYIHPRAPSDGMAAPFRDYRMEAAVWGYGMEVGTHAVRLMLGGVFDRFPKLKIVIGHMGEAVPFWLWRLDYMGNPARGRSNNKLKPSEYVKRNLAITTSGVEDPAALRYCIEKIGAENIMWAIDYPYQPTAPAVAWIDAAVIDPKHKEMICHGNAERIFHIPA